MARSPEDLAFMAGIPFEQGMDHEDVLALYFKKQGRKKVHFCPEWDFLAIHEDSPEFEACLCYK